MVILTDNDDGNTDKETVILSDSFDGNTKLL